MIDANLFSVALAMFAATAGTGLVVAAIVIVRRSVESDYDFSIGYNALAPLTDR